VNFIQSQGLNQLFQSLFLLEIGAEYGDVSYHMEVQWVSRGTVLKHFSTLRLEIKMFMNEKGKVAAELSDEKWHWDLVLLCDISHHVNNLNTKFQGKKKLISDLSGTVIAFEMKLKIFPKQLENVILCHFSSCDLLHMDESVSVPFPSVHAVEMTDSLAENFKMIFNDFRSHATIKHTYLWKPILC
jgi:hypothetical protein